MPKPIIRVAVTGGAGQIAYSLLFRIASGEMLGFDQPLELRILELPAMIDQLRGVEMELDDCAFPLLKKVHISSDPYEVFEKVDIALLVGAKPRGPGMERKDLLNENAKIFITQGDALNEKASRDALVLVVGNPSNTNALITLKHAPKLNPRRIFSMMRLDQNRGLAQIAKKAHVGVQDVKKMAVWGNHSATQLPDFTHATVKGKPLLTVIQDRDWLEKDFVPLVQKRGAAVIAARGKSSAASAANAALDSIKSLLHPTPSDDWFSVGLYSKGNPYNIDEDLIFSFPCRSNGNGEVEIVPNLHWDSFIKEKMAITQKELIEEREAILG